MFQKGINLGAKQTGKIVAGIAFFNNTTQTTDTTLAGNTWVRIGNSNPTHPLFIMLPVQPVSNPSALGVNDYFELTAETDPAQTQNQSIIYNYGKRAILYSSYSITVMQTIAGPPISPVELAVRVSSEDSVGNITVIDQSVRTFTYNGNGDAMNHVFPIVAPSQQKFYLEINRISAVVEINIIVREAILSLGE